MPPTPSCPVLSTQLAQAELAMELVCVCMQDHWLRGVQVRECRRLTVPHSVGRPPCQPWASLAVHLRGCVLCVGRVWMCLCLATVPASVPDSARGHAPHTLLDPGAQVQPCRQQK